MSKWRQTHRGLDREAAETIAIQALGYMAGQPEHFAQFLSATGVEVEDLRARAGSAEFLSAVLSYLSADESLLLAFAADTGADPEAVDLALTALDGGRRPQG